MVSGGSSGIGRAIARSLARAGLDVALVGRREAPLEEAAATLSREGSGSVTAHPCDLREPDQVIALGEQIVREFGAVDVIVNAAGGPSRGSPANLEQVQALWLADFHTNVLTAVLLTSALLEALRRPGGRVVAISSIAALRGGSAPYAAAKAALHGWVYSLAVELGPAGITVNAIAPGYTSGTEVFGGSLTEEGHRRRVAETLVGRPGAPTEIAAAVLYLASEEAAFVTGEILNVNGGAVFGR